MYILSLFFGKVETDYQIKDIDIKDDEMKKFLFSLGCFQGEDIKIISKISENLIIKIKDARYSIDKELAGAILI